MKGFEIGAFGIQLLVNCTASFVCLAIGRKIHIHWLVQKKYSQWGYAVDWHDGPMYSFGVGQWFLFCW